MTMETTIPRLAAAVTEDARRCPCPLCWVLACTPCTVSEPAGDHLARYQRAERRGLISRAELAAVVDGLDVIAAHVIVPERAA